MPARIDSDVQPAPAPTLYILAGGRSRRFGSDKARARVDGEPMLLRVAHALAPCVDDTFVVAAQPGAYDDLGVTTLGDETPGLGPIGGLATALAHRLHHRGPGWILLASCDLSEPSPGLVRPLLHARAQRGGHTAIAYRHAFWEPLLALYHTDTLPLTRESIRRGALAMHRLLACCAEPIPLPAGWAGIAQCNTPA